MIIWRKQSVLVCMFVCSEYVCQWYSMFNDWLGYHVNHPPVAISNSSFCWWCCCYYRWMYWLDGDLLMQAHMSGTPESISVVARSSSTILGLAYDPLLSAIYYTNQQDEMFRIEISRMGKATSSVQVSLAGVNLELLFVSIYQVCILWIWLSFGDGMGAVSKL